MYAHGRLAGSDTPLLQIALDLFRGKEILALGLKIHPAHLLNFNASNMTSKAFGMETGILSSISIM